MRSQLRGLRWPPPVRRSHVDADASPYGTVPTFDTGPRIMLQTLRIFHKERCPGQSPTTHSADCSFGPLDKQGVVPMVITGPPYIFPPRS